MLASAGLLALLTAAPSFANQLAVVGFGPAGQACPVTEHLALTARHVVEGRKQLRFSTGTGIEGRVEVVTEYPDADLALVKTEEKLTPYRVASNPPVADEKLWVQGFDWRKQATQFLPRVMDPSTFYYVFSGHLYYVPGGMPGTSGGCVLNQEGLAFAIDVGKREADDKRWGGVGVAIFGKWKPALPQP